MPQLYLPRDPAGQTPLDNTLLDGELVVDRLDDGREHRRFLVFDLLAIEGQSVLGKPFTSRLGRLTEFVLKPHQHWHKAYAIAFNTGGKYTGL